MKKFIVPYLFLALIFSLNAQKPDFRTGINFPFYKPL